MFSGDDGQALGWSETPLGPEPTWPQPVRTLVELMRASNQPMFIVWGPERTLLYNDEYAEILADKHPMALGRDFLEVWWEIRGDLEPIVAQAYAGEPVHMDDITLVMHRRGFAEEAHFGFSYTPVRDEAGIVGGFLCACVETTARIAAERTRAEALAAQARLFENAPSFIAVLTEPDHRFTLANRAFRRLAGGRDCVGRTAREVFHELADQPFFDLLDQVFRTGQRHIATGTPILLDFGPDEGMKERFLDFVYEPIRNDADAVTGIFVEGQDVSEQHHARRALERSEQRFRTALEIETVGALYFDMQGVLVDANDGFLTMSGFSREELKQGILSWQSLTPPEWLADSERAFAELKAMGRTTPYEKEYVRKDGTRWWGLFAAKLLPDGTGFEFVVDITDAKRAEARLIELNETLECKVMEEVAERSRTEDALRQSQKMEAIGQLTGGVAHDFNNLLTVIRSSADLLRRSELPEEKRRRYIDAISDTADRVAKLTGQLLAFARRQALRPEVFDAAQRVDDVADMLRTVLGARVELAIEARCRPCFVEADAGQFETALVNLAVNARDAMRGEGRLTITVDEVDGVPAVRGHAGAEGAFTAVAIIDTGSGIPSAVIDRIFEPFFTTKEIGQGTGLGLSQVFGFAKQSGGEVAVDSELGRGTTFRLYLPKVDGDAMADRRSEGEATPLKGSGRILVVEDNIAVGEFAAALLEDLGYTTRLAGNAKEAIAVLEGQELSFDLVFSDVVMPGIDGVEFGRYVRACWPGLPVVLTSGYSSVLADDARHGFPVLHKPYSVEELSRVLRQAQVGKRKAGRGPT